MSTQLLTVNEALERLALSRDKFYKLIRSGDLQTVKIGRARRVPEDAIEAFIDRHRVGGEAA